MKKKKVQRIIIPALAAALFIPLITFAASDEATTTAVNKVFRGGRGEMMGFERGGGPKDFANLSDEEKAAMEAHRAEMANMTEEEREALREEHRANMEAMKEAMDNNDYEAWAAIANENNCPFYSEVTADNFSEFVANHKNMGEMNGKKDGRHMGPRNADRATSTSEVVSE